MSQLWIRETFVNETRGYRFGESEPYETWTSDIGELYRQMRREYGGCVSKMFRDTAEGVQQVGWVFRKRMQYEDCEETYMREVWVEVFSSEPERSVSWKVEYPWQVEAA